MDNNTFTDSKLTSRNIKVLLIGCGGTGSFMVDELIALDTAMKALDPHSGLEVTLYDPSTVTESNLARQRFFPVQKNMNKAEALVWTANNLYGKDFKAKAESYNTITTHETADIIITALDKPSTRKSIYDSLLDNYKNIYWLDCGNDDKSGNVILGQLGKDKKRTTTRLPTVCDFFDYSDLSDKDSEIKSCSATESLLRQKLGVNAQCARTGGQLLFNLILDGTLTNNGAMFDIKDLSSTPLEINGMEWDCLLDDYVGKEAKRLETA